MSFERIRGQDRALAILTRALTSGRLPTAYLFTGPPGCGRKMAALAVAASLNCENSAIACGTCPSCLLASSGNHPDIYLYGAQEGKRQIVVKQAEEMREKAYLKPFSGRSSVFIVNGTEDMNTHTANSLLKVLEEPPLASRFILIASAREALLPTIVSRCQELAFHPLGPSLMEELLVERGVAPEKASLLARTSRGSMERALHFAEEEVAERLESEVAAATSLDRADTAALLALAERWGRNRQDALDALDLLSQWYRDMLLLAEKGPEEEVFHRAHLSRLVQGAARIGGEALAWGLEAIASAGDDLDRNANVELTLDRLFLALRSGASGEKSEGPWTN